jgi:hypothetical protein
MKMFYGCDSVFSEDALAGAGALGERVQRKQRGDVSQKTLSAKKQIVFAVKFATQAAQLVWHFHRNADAVAQQRIDGFDPQNLACKHVAEVSRNRLRDLVQIDFATQFFLHGGHRLRRNSAGDDEVEAAEIRIHIQSEAM